MAARSLLDVQATIPEVPSGSRSRRAGVVVLAFLGFAAPTAAYLVFDARIAARDLAIAEAAIEAEGRGGLQDAVVRLSHLEGDEAAALRARVFALLGRDHHDPEALARARAELRSARDDPHAFAAGVLLAEGEPSMAAQVEGALAEALEATPGDPGLLVLAGRWSRAQGRGIEALERAREALAAAPDHPGAHRLLVRLFSDRGELAGAQRHLEALRPLGDPEVVADLALVRLALGLPADELVLALRGLAAAPGSGGARAALALVILEPAGEGALAGRLDPGQTPPGLVASGVALMAAVGWHRAAAELATQGLGRWPDDPALTRLLFISEALGLAPVAAPGEGPFLVVLPHARLRPTPLAERPFEALWDPALAAMAEEAPRGAQGALGRASLWAGRRALAEGRYEEAARLLTRVLELEDRPEVRLDLGRAMLGDARPAAAAAVLEPLVAKDASVPRALAFEADRLRRLAGAAAGEGRSPLHAAGYATDLTLMQRAELALERRELDAALRHAARAVALSPALRPQAFDLVFRCRRQARGETAARAAELLKAWRP